MRCLVMFITAVCLIFLTKYFFPLFIYLFIYLVIYLFIYLFIIIHNIWIPDSGFRIPVSGYRIFDSV